MQGYVSNKVIVVLLQPIEAEWRTYASVKYLSNGLSPGWRQAIIWTNNEMLLIGPLEATSVKT